MEDCGDFINEKFWEAEGLMRGKTEASSEEFCVKFLTQIIMYMNDLGKDSEQISSLISLVVKENERMHLMKKGR